MPDEPAAPPLGEPMEPSRTLEEWREDATGSWECLEMIRETLAALIPMEGCPPMFYNDAIRSLAYRSALAGMRAVKREQGLMLTKNEAARLMPSASALLRQGETERHGF